MSYFEWVALQGLLPQLVGPLLVGIIVLRSLLAQPAPPPMSASQPRIDRRALRPIDRRTGGPSFAADVDRRAGERRRA